MDDAEIGVWPDLQWITWRAGHRHHAMLLRGVVVLRTVTACSPLTLRARMWWAAGQARHSGRGVRIISR